MLLPRHIPFLKLFRISEKNQRAHFKVSETIISELARNIDKISENTSIFFFRASRENLNTQNIFLPNHAPLGIIDTPRFLNNSVRLVFDKFTQNTLIVLRTHKYLSLNVSGVHKYFLSCKYRGFLLNRL